MPEGKIFGVERPGAECDIDGDVVFTRVMSEGNKLVVPEHIIDAFNLSEGDTLRITVYPLYGDVFDSGEQVFMEVDITSNNRITLGRGLSTTKFVGGEKLIARRALIAIKGVVDSE